MSLSKSRFGFRIEGNEDFGFTLCCEGVWLFWLFDLICAFFFVLFCRCREKQRKEASQLQTVNRKLAAMNKLLTEENERLQKQVSELVNENGFMRQQLQPVSPVIVHFHSLLV